MTGLGVGDLTTTEGSGDDEQNRLLQSQLSAKQQMKLLCVAVGAQLSFHDHTKVNNKSVLMHKQVKSLPHNLVAKKTGMREI